MRILLITYSLTSGGAERFVVDLGNSLAKEGHEVYLLATDDGQIGNNDFYLSELSPQIQYMNLHARSGHRLRALTGIVNYIRKTRPDIVHAHTDLIQLLIPVILCQKPKYFHTIHNVAEYFLPGQLWKPLFKALYSYRIYPVTISKTCSDSFRTLYGLSTDTLIENGRHQPPLSGQFEETRAQMIKFKDGKPLFIHVARFAPQKNQEVLFKAFGMLRDAKLLVLGGGYPEEVKAEQNPDNVLFMGEKHNVGDYLACSDFYVLSSLFEGLPLSLLEAMSYGVVPVSTPAGGVVDVLRDGESGYLSEDFTSEALLSTMKRAMMGTVSPEKVRSTYWSRYSMDNCFRKYLHLFEDNLK